MTNILITGINGFLGSSLAKSLSNKFKIIGTELSLDNLYRIKDYDFPVYSSDEENLKLLFEKHRIDIIIHTSTIYSRNIESVRYILSSNLVNPLFLFECAIKNKVGFFINTDTALDKFTSAYALSKKQFSDWLYYKSNEIKVANIQLEHFYGPGAGSNNFITSMITKLLNNEPQIDLTPGDQRRDFIFYDDVVNAYKIIINSRNKLKDKFNHFEVGTGELISIKELLILLKEVTKSNSSLNFGAIPYRENELFESKSNNESIVKLGWYPKLSLKRGLELTINSHFLR